MKKSLLTGLLVLLPITITLIILVFIVKFFTTPFLPHIEKLLLFGINSLSMNITIPQSFLVLLSRLVILSLLFIFILILGFLANKFFFKWIITSSNRLIMKIPLINKIYRVCRDISMAFLSDDSKVFKDVVTFSFPTEDSQVVGLRTGLAPKPVLSTIQEKKEIDTQFYTTYVPTAPHPLSGLLFIIDENRLKKVNISLEEFFKFIVSCGVYLPKEVKDD